MKRWLQEFSFKKSFYERPNQKWICGRACLGEGCLSGPDAKGNCTATAECRPLRKGDRWHCTRPAMQGGPCADGPLPNGSCCRTIPKCSPVRSLRSWRGLTVLLVVAVSLAFIFFLFASPRGREKVSPGELSFGHASAGSKCADCHQGAEADPISWVAQTEHAKTKSVDPQRCLRCHQVGDAPLRPHSMPERPLQALTQVAQKKNSSAPFRLQLASFIAGPARSSGEDLACSTCHKEHRGQNFDLKTLSNEQCQNCHSIQFDSFAKGHPEFTKYPFDRRTRIIFDHDSHWNKHFKENEFAKSAPVSCLDCHQTDLKGGTMMVKPFETVCASCHEDQIKGKGAVKSGVVFLAVPRVDDRVLTGDFGIGEWPEDADQALTPFARLLLSGDPELRAALDKLGDADLANLPKGDVEKIKAAQQIAWGIKALLSDLSTGGQEELIKRMSAAFKRPLSNREKESATAFLDAEVLRSAFQTSFPKLQSEVTGYRETKKSGPIELISSPPLQKNKSKAAAPDVWVGNGGWFSPEGSFALNYRPRGHSDRFLNLWMDLTVDSEKTPYPAGSKAVFNEIASPKAPGFCGKCHSADSLPSNAVNWHGAKPNPEEHTFNRFSHSTHMSVSKDEGCFTCHPFNSTTGEKTYAGAFEKNQRDPSQFHSNFQVIKKASCATCHQTRLANDNCLLCHNYHVGTFKNVAQEKPVFPVKTVAGK